MSSRRNLTNRSGRLQGRRDRLSGAPPESSDQLDIASDIGMESSIEPSLRQESLRSQHAPAQEVQRFEYMYDRFGNAVPINLDNRRGNIVLPEQQQMAQVAEVREHAAVFNFDPL